MKLSIIVPISLVACLCFSACGGNTAPSGAANTGGLSSTGNPLISGGMTGVGGASATGGSIAEGGTTAPGSTRATGGLAATGGTTTASSTTGSGCNGSFETIQSNTGLCVAKMATITAPTGSANYTIDVTEVTQGQYDAWLGTKPALPATTDVNCGYVTTYSEQATGYTGAGADHHPVAFVDWCDAHAYCWAVGKLLCGAIGENVLQYASASAGDTSASQWAWACSSGTMQTPYPYGDTYSASACDGYDYWGDDSSLAKTMIVGTQANCLSPTAGYTGVYDLSGNVAEWEDCCDTSGQSALCLRRGGSFTSYIDYLQCAVNAGNASRNSATKDTGFRCCSPSSVDVSGAGGSSSVGGAANGGSTSNGGTPAAGGTRGSGGTVGSGCSGSLEAVQSNTGLCVANSVLVIAPTRGTDYGIDATEVTQGQYDAWLATSPPLPAGTDADCGYVTSYAEHGTGYAGPNADHHPVVYVDWCDASQYCAGVGKNLCGLISGGATDFYTGTANASTNQWYRVCTSGDINAYPYGNTYQASTCDGYDYWGANTSTATTLAVGSLNGCVTSAIGYAGIYDLSGNVSEWQYSCNTSGPMASCKVQGGSFSNATNSSALTCSGATGNFRNAAYSYIGFRCCSS